MASAFSHIAVPIALNMALGRKVISWRLLFLAMFLSVAPDLDSIAFKIGIPYESPWGHRGFTHSILFAFLLSTVLIRFADFFKCSRKSVFFVSFVSLLSHGILDACTNGGLGVAFFWPVTDERYFLPWREIVVSPLSVRRFFTEWGMRVISSEILYIWLPCLLFGGIFYLGRRYYLKVLK